MGRFLLPTEAGLGKKIISLNKRERELDSSAEQTHTKLISILEMVTRPFVITRYFQRRSDFRFGLSKELYIYGTEHQTAYSLATR